jgi:hypothetical protein
MAWENRFPTKKIGKRFAWMQEDVMEIELLVLDPVVVQERPTSAISDNLGSPDSCLHSNSIMPSMPTSSTPIESKGIVEFFGIAIDSSKVASFHFQRNFICFLNGE